MRSAEELRETYPEGTLIVLGSMDDPFAPPPGTKGKVMFVDDACDIHVRWENGSELALIPGVDDFSVIDAN